MIVVDVALHLMAETKVNKLFKTKDMPSLK